MIRNPLRLIAGATGALLLSACASTAGNTGGGDAISHPRGREDLVVRIDVGGGFVPVEQTVTALPAFSLYGDGTIYLPGPQIAIYPPPALPALVRSTIDEAGIRTLLGRAEDAGLLGPDRSLTTMQVTDAPTTTFTVVADGHEHTTSVYGLGIMPDAAGMPASEREARRELVAFQRDVSDLRRWLPAGSIGPEVPAALEALRVFTGPYRGDPQVPQRPVHWPLTTPLDRLVSTTATGGLRCGVVAGDDLHALLPKLETANTLTPWIDGGRRSSLLVRPLLPDETGC